MHRAGKSIDMAKTPKQALEPLKIADEDCARAYCAHNPLARHALLTGMVGSRIFAADERPTVEASIYELCKDVEAVAKGDLTCASQMLVAQSVTLDALFAELIRRSLDNMGERFDAMERYMRLALKAQSACRSTLEILARLHQPREQTVKHVQVNHGGQAVVADQFHHHPAGE
jgi:hypothetical protein